MNFLDYRKRLGIAINDENKKQYFFTKIFNVLYFIDDDDRMMLEDVEYFDFCNVTGTQMHRGKLYGKGYTYILEELAKHVKSIESFLAYYMAFVNCLKNKSYRVYNHNDFYNILCNTLDQSQIPYEVKEDKDGYFIFPQGVKELDDALVSQNLEWLESYPHAREAFVKALRDYADQNDSNASEIADKFRKSLETFFQEFFKNEKSLENNKAEYGTYLKNHGIPAEISNNLETLFQAYTNYMNNYAKHHDKAGLNVLEYIMYQTGNIIRLLIRLENG